MYSSQFDYYQASSLDDAFALLAEHQNAKLLAGGHSLLPAMKLRLANPGVLIDISRIDELKGISNSGGTVRIGALTTHAMIARSDAVPAGLAEAASMVGDPQVRNRGTIGGNVAHADPASDLPTVLLALGATFHTTGPGGDRAIAADDFFTDMFTTALQDGEILTAVEVPAEGKGTGSAYAKLSNPASRYAMVGAAVSVTMQGVNCEAASVAVGGLTYHALRAPSVEAALVGNKSNDDAFFAAADAVQNDLGDDILDDIHASADYRRHMATVFVQRALEAAVARA